MDLISAFKSEILRPLITLLIPGLTATTPIYLYVILRLKIEAIESIQAFAVYIAIVITLTSIGAGIILENIGARIETFTHDLLVRSNQSWTRYLRLELKDEIIGQRYLKTILMRMKFELSMTPALIIQLIGTQVLFCQIGPNQGPSCVERVVITLAQLSIFLYFLIEIPTSVVLMDKTRNLIIDACNIGAIDSESEQKTIAKGVANHLL